MAWVRCELGTAEGSPAPLLLFHWGCFAWQSSARPGLCLRWAEAGGGLGLGGTITRPAEAPVGMLGPLPAAKSKPGLSPRITEKKDSEKIQAVFDPADVSGVSISHMVPPAFPGRDFPISAQEPPPNLQQSTKPPTLGPCRYKSYLPPRTPLHRAHGAQTERRERSLGLFGVSVISFGFRAAAGAPCPLTFLLPAEHNGNLQSHTEVLQRGPSVRPRGIWDFLQGWIPSPTAQGAGWVTGDSGDRDKAQVTLWRAGAEGLDWSGHPSELCL